MKKVGLIFPHQLFSENPATKETDEVWLIEDSLFFGDKHHPLKFHKQKLTLHRASMKSFAHKLEQTGKKVKYFDYRPSKTIIDIIGPHLNTNFLVVDPVDYLLSKRIKKSKASITFFDSPAFLNSKTDNLDYLKSYPNPKMQSFYRWQRLRLGILLDKNKEPLGGKWSFDSENRKKIPLKQYPLIPKDPEPVKDKRFVAEAKQYVNKVFPNNYGKNDNFYWPIDHDSAQAWLNKFLAERLLLFGNFEDAITQQHHILYHSGISALLNIGILTPEQVIKTTLNFTRDHEVSMNSLEGFIRQIIGWREFIRLSYEQFGTEIRNSNMWKHHKKLSKSFYEGNTGIDPVDNTIKKLQETAYAHHIERLMVMGNLMFLLEISPNQTYNWFMEMFIDAYDWVMVPNVYAMSQNTTNNLITTKPYFSSANYILKMSDYQKGNWSDKWNALFWSFVHKHKNQLTKMGRMSLVVKNLDKIHESTMATYKEEAKVVMSQLTN